MSKYLDGTSLYRDYKRLVGSKFLETTIAATQFIIRDKERPLTARHTFMVLTCILKDEGFYNHKDRRLVQSLLTTLRIVYPFHTQVPKDVIDNYYYTN